MKHIAPNDTADRDTNTSRKPRLTLTREPVRVLRVRSAMQAGAQPNTGEGQEFTSVSEHA